MNLKFNRKTIGARIALCTLLLAYGQLSSESTTEF